MASALIVRFLADTLGKVSKGDLLTFRVSETVLADACSGILEALLEYLPDLLVVHNKTVVSRDPLESILGVLQCLEVRLELLL